MKKLRRSLVSGAAAVIFAALPLSVHADSSGPDRTYNDKEMLAPVMQSVYRVQLSYETIVGKDGELVPGPNGSKTHVLPVGTGSAVLIGQAPGYKYFVTNYHVANGASELEDELRKNGFVFKIVRRIVTIYKPGVPETPENAIEVTPIENDDSQRIDIVFLQASEASLKGNDTPVKVSLDLLKPLQAVDAIGYPGVADHDEDRAADPTPTDGQVARVYMGTWNHAGGSPYNLIQHNAAISPGNSGGGLFDMCGALVGINTQTGPRYQATKVTTNDQGKIEFENVEIPATGGVGFASSATELAHILPPNVKLNIATGVCKKAGPPTPPPPLLVQPPRTINPLFIFAGVAGLAALAVGGFAYLNLRSKPKATGGAVKAAPTPDALRLPPASGGRLVLNGKDGNGVNQRLEINKALIDTHPNGVIVGREPAAGNVRIADDRAKALVSREHARIGLKGDNFQIEDANSSNGTFVNADKLVPYQPKILRSGDKIRLADLEFTVDIN